MEKIVKDLILKKYEVAGKKATMHIIENDDGTFSIINDLLGGRKVFTAKTIDECDDWFFDRIISGFTKIYF